MRTRPSTLSRVLLAAVLAPALGLLGTGSASAILVRTAVRRPLARAAVVTTAAVATAVVVGSVVRSLPPSCTSTMVGNIAYQQCDGHWYQPRYSGTEVTYVVVNPPR